MAPTLQSKDTDKVTVLRNKIHISVASKELTVTSKMEATF